MSYKNKHDPRYKKARLKWYFKNREKVRVQKKKRYQERQDWFVKYKSKHSCTDCGKFYPSYVMDFDHRNGKEKKFLVSNLRTASWETLLKEVKKCDLVCSNCHRIRTYSHSSTDRMAVF